MTSKIIVVAAAAVGVSLATVACSAPATAARIPASGHVRGAVEPARAETLAEPGTPARNPQAIALAAGGSRVFGSGCRILHRRGLGSEATLASAPVSAALSQAPGLSELARAIQRAGLARMLNAAKALTVFAPDNGAFDALGTGNLRALLATRADLVRVLKFHLVAGRVTPAELVRRHVLTTVAGTKLHLVRVDHHFGVNNATVTCGNVQTSNATVYVVDRLVVPGS